jgi:hypothetical protein
MVNVLTQAPAPKVFISYSSVFLTGSWGVFDAPSSAFKIDTGSVINNEGVEEELYGSGNGAFGAEINSAVILGSVANRVITGASGNSSFSGITKAWSTTPYNDVTTNSGAYSPDVSGRGAGTFSFNGVTNVNVAAATITAVDIPVIVRTTFVGATGNWRLVSTTPGVGFAVVSDQVTDNGAASFKLVKG